MSTRWYPIYQRGNPQLRVFLPNFWVKLVKPVKKYPKNVVVFQTSIEMTNHDVKNYLEKIYKLPIVEIKTDIVQGKIRRSSGRQYIVKDDDYKEAVVTLPRDHSFTFPDLFPKPEKTLEEQEKQIIEAQEQHSSYSRRNQHRPGVPGWFSF